MTQSLSQSLTRSLTQFIRCNLGSGDPPRLWAVFLGAPLKKNKFKRDPASLPRSARLALQERKREGRAAGAQAPGAICATEYKRAAGAEAPGANAALQEHKRDQRDTGTVSTRARPRRGQREGREPEARGRTLEVREPEARGRSHEGRPARMAA